MVATIEALKGKDTIIRCSTEKEYLECLVAFEKAGISWKSRNKATDKNYWKDLGNTTIRFEKTCITNGDKGTTISAQEFLTANSQPVTEIGNLADTQENVKDEWRIGDKLPYSWLSLQKISIRRRGAEDFERWTGRWNGEYDREITEVEDGYGHVSSSNLWLSPKSNYPTYPGNISPTLEPGIKMQVQMPVQADPATTPIGLKIGDRVERLNGEGKGFSQHISAGTKGTVTQLDVQCGGYGDGVGVKWDNGKNFNCLLQNLKSISETINNNNLKPTQNNEYENKCQGTAVNLSANPSTVCRADRRTATPVRQSGQSILITRGYRSNSKSLRLS